MHSKDITPQYSHMEQKILGNHGSYLVTASNRASYSVWLHQFTKKPPHLMDLQPFELKSGIKGSTIQFVEQDNIYSEISIFYVSGILKLNVCIFIDRDERI